MYRPVTQNLAFEAPMSLSFEIARREYMTSFDPYLQFLEEMQRSLGLLFRRVRHIALSLICCDSFALQQGLDNEKETTPITGGVAIQPTYQSHMWSPESSSSHHRISLPPSLAFSNMKHVFVEVCCKQIDPDVVIRGGLMSNASAEHHGL